MQSTNEHPPLVAIEMITYNHEKYIALAIESVLMQKTLFNFKLIICEDCSTDATAQICQQYQNKYPDKIDLYLNEKNRGVKINAKKLHEISYKSKARYTAILDGDDYWTDNLKLQKQVDFLENNLDYVMCFTNASIDNLKLTVSREIYCGYTQDSYFTQKDVIRIDFHVPTLTMVFRNGLIQIPEWFSNIRSGDTFLQILLSKFGKFKYLNQITGVYRSHPGGITNTKLSSWILNTLQNLPNSQDFILKENSILFRKYIYDHRLLLARLYFEEGEFRKSRKCLLSLFWGPLCFYKENWKSILVTIKLNIQPVSNKNVVQKT